MVSQAISDIGPTISITATTTATTTSEENIVVKDELSKIHPNLVWFHKPLQISNQQFQFNHQVNLFALQVHVGGHLTEYLKFWTIGFSIHLVQD